MKLKLTILPFCLIAIQAFAFEGTIKQTIKNYNSTGADVTMTWHIGQHSVRIDMAATNQGYSSNTVLILDQSSKVLSTYEVGGSSAQKLYYQVGANTISGGVSNLSVVKTTETRQIQGYKCEKWAVTTATGSYDVWIARDVDFDAAAYKDFFKTSAEVQALVQQGVKGFPILTESKNGDNAASVSEISAGHQSDATFTVPSEYKLYTAQAAPAPAKTK